MASNEIQVYTSLLKAAFLFTDPYFHSIVIVQVVVVFVTSGFIR